MKILLILLASFSLLHNGNGQSCSLDYPAAVHMCMQPFIAPNPSYIFMGDALMDAVNSDMLNTACRQRAEVDNCVKNAGGCNNVWEFPDWVGLNDSLNYICGEGRPAFEKFQNCTTKYKVEYDTVFKLCMLGLPLVTNSSDPLQNCRYVLGKYSCYVNSSKAVCDSEKFMINYFTKLHQPMDARTACKLDNVNWNIKDLNMKCNASKAAECMASFTQGPYKVFSNGSFMTTNVNSSFLIEACKAHSNNKVCMNYTGRCKYFELADYWGIIESMDFLCDDKNAVNKYQGCTRYSELFGGIRLLLSRLFDCQRLIRDTSNNMVSGQQCRVQNNNYNCYVQVAKDCDSENFIKNYYKKLMQPTQSLKDCYLDNTRLNDSSYSQCDSGKLMVCINRMREIDDLLMTFKQVSLTSSQFKEYCLLAYDTHRCVQEQALCTDIDRVARLNWLGIKNAWNYICLENKEGAMEFGKCLFTDNMEVIRGEFAKCYAQDINPSDDAVAMCRYANEAHKCAVAVAQTFCLQGGYEKELYFYRNKDALRANYSCEFEWRSSHGTSLKGGVAYAMLKTMMAFIMIIILKN